MTKKLFTLILFLPLTVLAHGEEKPGPNGGHVRMPGPFHTELEIDSVQGAHIFLLDLNFQNPTVKDSAVEVSFKGEKAKNNVTYKCGIMGGNHFHCVPQGKIAGKGVLKVKATREKAVGNEVTYDIPLKPFTNVSDNKPVDHSHH
ncbi:MAG: hypothetical protein J7501_04070 [Bdellovibrio sp.]|nr:hypothetical protein [Bdellovibrio sp.]